MIITRMSCQRISSLIWKIAVLRWLSISLKHLSQNMRTAYILPVISMVFIFTSCANEPLESDLNKTVITIDENDYKNVLNTSEIIDRSEERRVGKECRYRWTRNQEQKK